MPFVLLLAAAGLFRFRDDELSQREPARTIARTSLDRRRRVYGTGVGIAPIAYGRIISLSSCSTM
jgi:hypothetical protein